MVKHIFLYFIFLLISRLFIYQIEIRKLKKTYLKQFLFLFKILNSLNYIAAFYHLLFLYFMKLKNRFFLFLKIIKFK